MARSHTSTPSQKAGGTTTSLMVRLDAESKAYIARAAKLRQISVSDYVRTVLVAQARREVQASNEQIITLSSEEQFAFWKALNEAPNLTDAQRELGSVMRGEL
jgi:uncharacterized protein (DUF1778 family)